MDSALPPWVVQGLASHVAMIGQPPEGPQPEAFAPKGVALGGEQWRWQRASQDRLEEHGLNLNEAEAKASFLLTGFDGKHAPQFIALVRQALDDAARNAAAGGQFRRFAGSNQPPARHTAFDDLVQQNQSQFEAWQTDRQAGLPIVPQAQDATPEFKQAQTDMLVVLKLLRRLQVVQSAVKPVKVITFDRQAGQAVAATPPQPLPTISDLAKRLADLSQPPLATIDTSGRLLLSSDRRRVSELLGFDRQRFRTRQLEGKCVVATRLADGSELCGWLEDNPEKPLRPIAKFSVAKRDHAEAGLREAKLQEAKRH
jgi:hypothetical protein